MSNQTQYIPLGDVPKIVEQLTGNRPHVTTIYRWRQRGINGAKLRTRRIGNGRYTTREWLEEFFDGSDRESDEPTIEESHAIKLRVDAATEALRRRGLA